MSLLTIDSYKDIGNKAFKRQEYREATRLYTQALDAVNDTTPREIQRTLLSNRSQAFICSGVIHEALRDVNSALSPQYTSQDSPKLLTAKCHYRRAKLLCSMARYDEAQADYGDFATIMKELGREVSDDELEFKRGLDSKAVAGEDSEQRRRDELIRAIDARGFFLRQAVRATFPQPPPNVQERLGPDFCSESMTIGFDTEDSRPYGNVPDPNLTPISIPVTIRAPYFFPDPNKQTPFLTREEVPTSEYDTIGSVVDGLFMSMAMFHGQQNIPSAVAHDRDGVLIMISSRGRIFKVPRETKIKDVVAGARWPRQSGAPVFEDLCRAPRRRNEEIDGIELSLGWMIEVFVVADDKLGAFVDRSERAFAAFGI